MKIVSNRQALEIITSFLRVAKRKARKYARRHPRQHQSRVVVDARGWFLKMNTRKRMRVVKKIAR